MTLREVIEAELDRLAARHESPAVFEALFRCLWLADSPDNSGVCTQPKE